MSDQRISLSELLTPEQKADLDDLERRNGEFVRRVLGIRDDAADKAKARELEEQLARMKAEAEKAATAGGGR